MSCIWLNDNLAQRFLGMQYFNSSFPEHAISFVFYVLVGGLSFKTSVLNVMWGQHKISSGVIK